MPPTCVGPHLVQPGGQQQPSPPPGEDVVIMTTPAAMATWGLVHQVDVTNGTSLSDAQVTAPFSFHKIVHFDTQCVGHS